MILRLFLAIAVLCCSCVFAQAQNVNLNCYVGETTPQWLPCSSTNPLVVSDAGSVTNPTSTLSLTSTTSAYTVGQFIANNSTGTDVTIPSFSIANSGGAAIIPRLRLSINDSLSTAWGTQTIQIDLWSAAPTFASGSGDRSTFDPATGTADHLGAYTCLMSPEYGDGVYGECYPQVGTASLPKLSSGTSIYWTPIAVTGSGTVTASKTMTLTAELQN